MEITTDGNGSAEGGRHSREAVWAGQRPTHVIKGNKVNPPDKTDFAYNGQNLAVYSCEYLEMLRH
jgi:hypothetical protein